jgi:phospholipase/carboxylesterase
MAPTPLRPPAGRDPHANQPIRAAGPSPESAAATLLLVHGRGATAESILTLYGELNLPQVAALAPQAAGQTWYPQSFLAQLDANQPYLDSALARLATLVGDLLDRSVPSERIVLLGFSQGACLTLEFAARNPRRYGALIGLTGGLLGPPGTPRAYPGSFEGTPVFLGAGDPDPHVPFERVQETAAVLGRMHATVDLRRYPGLPHTINQDELDACRDLVRRAAAAASPPGYAGARGGPETA